MTEQHLKRNERLMAKTLFIMGDFPAISQTFILREFQEMKNRSLPINVLADKKIFWANPPDWLHAILSNAKYLNKFLSTARGAIKALYLWKTMSDSWRWANRLPHKNLYYRSRFLIALFMAFDIRRWVSNNFDYIYAHFAAFQTELAMCISYLTGLPFVASWHSYGIWKDGNILQQKIQSARMVFVCTGYSENYLKRLAPESLKKIHLVYHGLERSLLNQNNGHIDPQNVNSHDTKTWVAVGRLVPKKGFVYLLQATAILRSRGISTKVKIIGEGSQRKELQKLVQQLKLTDIVTLYGSLPNFDVQMHIQSSFGLVAPCIRLSNGDIDGIPNVILEAMALGRPVIATSLSGIPEVVHNNINGILVPPGDELKIADAMERLIENASDAECMGRQGPNTIHEKFNVIHAIDQQLTLLNQYLYK